MRKLGQYELGERIGSGSAAEVWTGHAKPETADAQTIAARNDLAVKLLAKHLAQDPRVKQMFVEQARLSMLLSHANIVQVVDVGEDQGESYMVMELVQGTSLARLNAKLREAGERLPVEVAAFIIGEILRALVYAHELDGSERAIVHRDLNPANVMLSDAGEVKLLDFGITPALAGKLRYLAPEQVAGGAHETASDLFAVGALFHELLDGQEFRAELTDDELRDQPLTEVPTLTVAKSKSKLPAELELLRRALLAPRPEDRPSSARLALEALLSWPGYRNTSLELMSVATPARPSPERAPAQISTKLIMLVVLVVALISLGVGFGVGIGFTHDERSAAAPNPGDAAPDEPLAPVFRAQTDKRGTEPALGAAQSPQPCDDCEPGSPGKLPTKVGPKPVATKPKPVPVEFVANDYFYVEVRLGEQGSKLAVEPRTRTTLAPGSYTLYLRTGVDTEWKHAGRITLEAGKRYQVDMIDPPGARLVEL